MNTLELTDDQLHHLHDALARPDAPKDWQEIRALVDAALNAAYTDATCAYCHTPFRQSRSGRPARFCKDSCKQAAYRQRKAAERQTDVTKQTVTPHQNNIAEFLYVRKGKGVTHLVVSPGITLCKRESANMEEAPTPENDAPLCKACIHVRDTQTWWQGYRKAFYA